MSSTSSFFFFNDTATTEIYTLSLHDALPIYPVDLLQKNIQMTGQLSKTYSTELDKASELMDWKKKRSEEHTSELQSQSNLVCRLLLEKKKKLNSTRSRVVRTSYLKQSPIAND